MSEESDTASHSVTSLRIPVRFLLSGLITSPPFLHSFLRSFVPTVRYGRVRNE